MSGLLEAARLGDLAKVQRLVGEGANVREVDRNGNSALLSAVMHAHSSVAKWLLKTGRARISEVNHNGFTALSIAATSGPHYLVRWLLEEGGAKITDVVMIRGEYRSIWKDLNVYARDAELPSLLRVMVLLGDAPADFIAKLSPQNAQIVTQGQRIRALRPLYLKQQQNMIQTTCPLPNVLHAIVATYVEPTPEDMWTDWAQWM
jgi:hypothetical protein